VLMRAEG